MSLSAVVHYCCRCIILAQALGTQFLTWSKRLRLLLAERFVLLPPLGRLCGSRCLSICLLATLRKMSQTNLHEIFRESWQWAKEQIIKFWWQSGSPYGYRDCFPDLLLLGNTESGINLTLQCTACTSRRRHSNYDVITSPALGGGMHCPSASSFDCIYYKGYVSTTLVFGWFMKRIT